MREVSAPQLRGMLLDGGEIALLDVREEGSFSNSHILLARSLPLSRLELRVLTLVPRKSARIVVCDAGGSLAARAADKLTSYGYSDIAILSGGVEAWREAGYVLFSGFNVPSKAFGEIIEHEEGTPNITAEELHDLIETDGNFTVLDSRPWDEYYRMNIPTGIDAPGAELVYRVHDLAPKPETLVIVNCAGRTRSIIGAQSLINAGIPNKVVALRNGTMGWELAGYQCEHGSERVAAQPSDAGLSAAKAAAARVAQRFGVRAVDTATVKEWCSDESRSLFLLDVRTPEEFATGHVPGSVHAPGGQLVQGTDGFIGVLAARIVLIDGDGVRATMTASWLIQMGWTDVYVWSGALEDGGLETGPTRPPLPDGVLGAVDEISPTGLKDLLDAGTAVVVDTGDSRAYRRGHIPGAWFVVRARLRNSFVKLPAAEYYIFTANDSLLAVLSAQDAQNLTDKPVRVLDGGTAAWRDAGLPVVKGEENMADTPDDVSLKAYDRASGVQQAMEEYLAWELALPGQIKKDGTVNFKLFPADG